MGIKFNKGFFIFDKSWIHENDFFSSLSHAEFRIMIYLLSSALKLSKRGSYLKSIKWFADLYQYNHLLLVNVAQRTIAARCKVNRSTVISALKKFEDIGAVVIISNHEDKNNHIYLIGFERLNTEEKHDFFLVDSIPIKSGKKLPDQMKNLIKEHYQDERLYYSDKIWCDLFGIKKDTEVEVVAG
jgi:hypothetical protein